MDDGNPAPLGATVSRDGVNFALHSSIAERVELCLFDRHGAETARHDLPARTGDVWHGFARGLADGQHYGYRVHGPWSPENGLWCNPAKLLIDPYARQLAGEFRWHPSVVARHRADSAPFVPHGVVRDILPGNARRNSVPWGEAIFYETNLRGFTMLHEAVPEMDRGRFAGMRNAEVLQHIRSLGVTSIEFLPVHAFIDEHHLVRRRLRNFWGYNTIGFFAPMARFARVDPVTEFLEMVRAIHDAGLEVILDVVYNHTGEGNQDGPCLSFRGIDNEAYYRLRPDRKSRYVDDTGCGNTINADSPVVQKLVLDSLIHWHRDLEVDGFRFDLATVLGRHAHGFSSDHPLLASIANNRLLRDARLVAEPWDPGPGGYQLGQFHTPWAELNDKFRDATRRFWRGDEKLSGELARRMHGSAELFEAGGRPPHACVNKVTSHDGFTLADVVAYEHRHNRANGENNRDGHHHNFSRNYGVEGPTSDATVNLMRRRQRLNMLATLLCSQGTPFLLAGDEFGNSQSGNNNAYAQDNPTGWLNWKALDADPDFLASVRRLIRIRRHHPLLRLDHYVHGERIDDDGTRITLQWINPNGQVRSTEDWDFGHAFGMLLTRNGAEGFSGIAVLLNAWTEPLLFDLSAQADGPWRLLFTSGDTGMDEAGRAISVAGMAITICAAGAGPDVG